jgi:hypothetical protein
VVVCSLHPDVRARTFTLDRAGRVVSRLVATVGSATVGGSNANRSSTHYGSGAGALGLMRSRPEAADVVRLETSVGGDEGESFELRLRYEHPIEGIAVVQR